MNHFHIYSGQPTRKILNLFRTLSLILFFTFIILEGMLRVFPSSIPLSILYYFNDDLRANIAAGLGMTSLRNTQILQRDDGGPPLRVLLPGQTIVTRFKDKGIVNRVTMDWNGFCNPRPLLERIYIKKEIDVLTVGDSFTWCTTVNPADSWPHQLASISGKSVYNLSRSGIGTYEYIQLIKKFGLQLNPKVIIMNVYLGNDLRGAISYHEYIASGGKYKITSEKKRNSLFQRLINNWIAQHSYSYNLALASPKALYYHFLRIPPRITNETQMTIDFRYTVSKGGKSIKLNLDNSDLDEIVIATKLKNNEGSLNLFDKSIEEFSQLAHQENFTPIIAITPSAYAPYDKYLKFNTPQNRDILANYVENQRTYFRKISEKHNIIFVDMMEPLETAVKKNPNLEPLLYFPTNLHLTAEGHHVVAKAISTFLN